MKFLSVPRIFSLIVALLLVGATAPRLARAQSSGQPPATIRSIIRSEFQQLNQLDRQVEEEDH